MIYVLTRDHAQFQNFLHEHHLRAHMGSGGNREGQCQYLSEMHALDGRRGIVLTWGTWFERNDAYEIRDYCAARDIPFLEVLDLRRARHFQERLLRFPHGRW